MLLLEGGKDDRSLQVIEESIFMFWWFWDVIIRSGSMKKACLRLVGGRSRKNMKKMIPSFHTYPHFYLFLFIFPFFRI